MALTTMTTTAGASTQRSVPPPSLHARPRTLPAPSAARLDLDAALADIDLNELLARLDMDALVSNTELGGIIAQSTSGVASNVLDGVRSQGVGIDGFIARVANRMLLRDPAQLPAGPPLLTGDQLALPAPPTT